MTDEPGSEPHAALRLPVAGQARAFRRWIVLRAGREKRWGGEIRRQMIFEQLADRTGALVVESWPYVQGYTRDRFWPSFLPVRRKPFLAVTEQPPESVIPWIVKTTDPVAVAIYDDPVAQTRALGIHLTNEQAAELGRLRRLAMTTFRWHVVPTASFAELSGLDPDRVVVGGNGTLTDEVRPGPWPADPSIGFVSGAAPGRGIEALVEACRLLRDSWADLRLYLWLVATSPSAEQYLADLRTTLANDPWITIGAVGHAGLGAALAQATILCIPHPANEYMDVALPVKLLDSMAAGRPLVVTPRRETAAIVERYRSGLVAGGDAPADLADAFERLLRDPTLARRLGAAGRAAAVQDFDWKVVGDRIATEILGREGRRKKRWGR
jgi:glycosyltransferase involved in cell wall biosynthesis